MWSVPKVLILIIFRLISNFVSAETGEPKIKPFQFSTDINLGMREAVHCIVTYGEPPFEFMWFKDGQLLESIRGISYRKTDEFMSSLVISKVDADSNGNYTCRVTNSVGSDQKSAVLSVKGKKRFVCSYNLIRMGRIILHEKQQKK
ncbi:titin [Nephila pilipes]|uniref:Titin n=1 Tax=Nephila pilipes TaxID=299642 RepID=A0A8X6QR24_NEPPI|nr:titin [Nephila pilipes]